MNSVHEEHNVLVLNFGSASLKAASYALATVVGGETVVPRETGRAAIETKPGTSPGTGQEAELLLSELMARLSGFPEAPRIVVHRIVHGADRHGPVELTDPVLTQLQELAVLAPLHQPPALALVRAAIQRWPDACQIGVFDTSWHQTMPEPYRLFAIPYSLYESGVKRYGFHGLAFQSVMRQMGVIAPELAQARMVLAHLGSGSSSMCGGQRRLCQHDHGHDAAGWSTHGNPIRSAGSWCIVAPPTRLGLVTRSDRPTALARERSERTFGRVG